jgi:hypothetical protein
MIKGLSDFPKIENRLDDIQRVINATSGYIREKYPRTEELF